MDLHRALGARLEVLSPVLNSAWELALPQVSTQPLNYVQEKCYLEVRCIKTVGWHEAGGCSFSALHPDSQAVPKRALNGTLERSTPPYSSSLQRPQLVGSHCPPRPCWTLITGSSLTNPFSPTCSHIPFPGTMVPIQCSLRLSAE